MIKSFCWNRWWDLAISVGRNGMGLVECVCVNRQVWSGCLQEWAALVMSLWKQAGSVQSIWWSRQDLSRVSGRAGALVMSVRESRQD